MIDVHRCLERADTFYRDGAHGLRFFLLRARVVVVAAGRLHGAIGVEVKRVAIGSSWSPRRSFGA